MITRLEKALKALPPVQQNQVADFAEFLADKKTPRLRRRLRLDWSAAAGELREQYTSVELQHLANQWRNE